MTVFEPFSTLPGDFTGSFWDHFLDQKRVFLCDFGLFLRSIRDHFGVTLGLFWHRFGIIFGPFWCVFEPFWRLLGLFRLGQKRVILAGFGSKNVLRPCNPVLKRTPRGTRSNGRSWCQKRRPFYIGIENLFRSHLLQIDILQKPISV